MKSTQILTVLNLPATKDSKTYCSQLERICTTIIEIKKLPWYTFEVGPVISNTELLEKRATYQASELFPKQAKYNAGGPYELENVKSNYGNKWAATANDIINQFSAYQVLTVNFGSEDLILGIGGTYTFYIPANNIFCEYVLTLIGHTVETIVKTENSKKAYFHAILPAGTIDKIKAALLFCGRDTLRPAMLGVCLDFRNNEDLVIVSTDAHRLYRSNGYGCETTTRKPHTFIIPVATCKALIAVKRKDVNEPIRLTVYRDNTPKDIQVVDEKATKRAYGNQVIYKTITEYSRLAFEFSCGTIQIPGALINARFPAYDQVIPFEQPYKIEVDRKTLLQHIAQNVTAANPITKKINFHFNGKVTLEAFDIDLSQESKTSFDYVKSNADNLDISFQGNLLAEILKGMDTKTVTLEMSTCTRCAFVNNSSNKDLRLLMPLM